MESGSDARLEAARDQRARELGAALRGQMESLRRACPSLRTLCLGILVVVVVMLYAREMPEFGASRAAMFTVLAAAIVSSVAGFAFSALSGAVLVHLVESPVAAVQIMLVCSIGMQCLCVWTLRRDIDWGQLPKLLLGGLAGLPVGLWLLLHLDRNDYMRVLGGLLLLYGGWMLVRRAEMRFGWAGHVAIPAGVLGGLTGGMAALPGPVVTIWCSVQGWSKARQRAVTQAFILIMQLVSLAALYGIDLGALPRTAPDLATWAYVPAALLGTMIGLALFRRLSDRQFAATVNALLIVSGLGLLT